MDKKLKPLRFIDPSIDKSLFLSTLRERVDRYFTEHNISKKYNSTMVLKTILMLSLYLIPFVFYLSINPSLQSSILLWSIMAIGMAGIGMSIMHDANHGAYTDSYRSNQLLGYIVNIVGAFAFNWKIQHNLLHHTYTNITGYDDDIDDKSILKLSPHSEVKWFHKYQYIYAFFFYAIATLYWSILKDFLQFIRYKQEGLNKNSSSENRILFLRLIIHKFLYFFTFLVVPTLFFDIDFSKTAWCFVVMHLIASTILTTVFQLAHTVVGTTHPLPNARFIVENDWAIHQMETTVNFAPKNGLVTYFVGGLNFQIEHHLFPNICHVHYPQIAPILKQTAEEYQIPYLQFSSLGSALKGHVDMLKKLGKESN